MSITPILLPNLALISSTDGNITGLANLHFDQPLHYTIMILHHLSIYTSMKHSLLQTQINKRLRFIL